MIYRLMNEWDSLSPNLPNEAGEPSGIGEDICIDYGKQNDYAVASAYAYLFYGKDSLSAGDREAIKTIRVTDETGSRFKMFLRGTLNPLVTGTLLELLEDKVKKDLMDYFARKGHKGLAPLMLYDLDIEHQETRDDLADVLRECGFDVPRNLFRTEDSRNVYCINNDSGISILPTTQLMVITDDDGLLSAYLSNCPLCRCTLRQITQPPATNPPKDYISAKRCPIEEVKRVWNEYVKTL